MPLSWNEIKDRALAFSRDWADESSERAEAKSFWDAFFNVFGVSRRKVATFEEPARRLDASRGYIDLFWKGMLVKIAPDATPFHLGVLSATMHMAWVRYTCGRLKSDYRYSKDIVYNNFPWPKYPEAKHVNAIEEAAQGVLDARARFPGSSLADLYDPLTMPPALTKAHHALDRAVDGAYLAGTKRKEFANNAERVAFLFELYQQYTSLLPAETQKPHRRKRAS